MFCYVNIFSMSVLVKMSSRLPTMERESQMVLNEKLLKQESNFRYEFTCIANIET